MAFTHVCTVDIQHCSTDCMTATNLSFNTYAVQAAHRQRLKNGCEPITAVSCESTVVSCESTVVSCERKGQMKLRARGSAQRDSTIATGHVRRSKSLLSASTIIIISTNQRSRQPAHHESPPSAELVRHLEPKKANCKPRDVNNQPEFFLKFDANVFRWNLKKNGDQIWASSFLFFRKRSGRLPSNPRIPTWAPGNLGVSQRYRWIQQAISSHFWPKSRYWNTAFNKRVMFRHWWWTTI